MSIPIRDPAAIERRRKYSLALCALPVLACGTVMLRYGIDAPYMDAWWYLPLIEKSFYGGLRPADFWFTINEHRVVAPAVITVLLARLTHWDMRWEHGATLLFALLAYGIVLRRLIRVERDHDVRDTLWCAPLGALLAFSATQHAIWNWGLHLMIAFTLWMMVVALDRLACAPLRRRRLAGAVAAAVVATFSFGAGVAVWPAGAVVLLCSGQAFARKRGSLVVWCGAAGMCAAIYWMSHTAATLDANAPHVVTHPFSAVLYGLAYIGAPLTPYSAALAVVAGGVFVGASVCLAASCWNRPDASWDTWAFVWGLIAMAVSCAVLTALKQSVEGPGQALSSRYLVWPTVAWVGIMFLLYLRRSEALAQQREGAARSLGFAAALLAGLILLGNGFGVYQSDETYDAFLIGRNALYTGAPESDLHWLYPEPRLPLEWRERLIRLDLTIFRGGHNLTFDE